MRAISTPDEQSIARELRRDPVTGNWVVIAPGRSKRPGASVRADQALLTDEEVGGVATAWRERAAAARAAGFSYVHALLNEGREAGASLPHSHTQLAWLDDVPPAVEAESDECSVC